MKPANTKYNVQTLRMKKANLEASLRRGTILDNTVSGIISRKQIAITAEMRAAIESELSNINEFLQINKA